MSITVLRDTPKITADIRAWKREAGSKLWVLDGEFTNILLNQWYLDLFTSMQPPYPTTPSLSLSNIAFGYGVSPTFARTDTALKQEWTSTIATLTSASGTSAGTTSLSVTALPMMLGAPMEGTGGVTHVVLGNAGTPQTLTVTPMVAAGGTTLTVSAFTPNQNWPIGTPILLNDTTIHVPQRPSTALTTFPNPNPDPVSATYSFVLSAAANTVPITFTEAALIYANNSKAASHVALSYTKDSNTDLLIQYTLTRSTT